MSEAAGASQRIDKWLWYARFFKTRTLAAAMVTGGKVRLTTGTGTPAEDTQRVSRASQSVKAGDVLTFPQGGHVRVIRVLDPGARRGPAAEAQALYEDLAPPQPRAKALDAPDAARVAEREPGGGRPTKRERRATDRLRGR